MGVNPDDESDWNRINSSIERRDCNVTAIYPEGDKSVIKTCRSCYNYRDERKTKTGGIEVDCQPQKWVPIIEIARCRQESAAREPGVDEQDWED